MEPVIDRHRWLNETWALGVSWLPAWPCQAPLPLRTLPAGNPEDSPGQLLPACCLRGPASSCPGQGRCLDGVYSSDTTAQGCLKAALEVGSLGNRGGLHGILQASFWLGLELIDPKTLCRNEKQTKKKQWFRQKAEEPIQQWRYKKQGIKKRNLKMEEII